MAQASIEQYRVRPPRPASPTWRAFLKNHLTELVALAFFPVPTVGVTVLFVLIVLARDRRKLRHFNVTEHPTAPWTAQQRVEAFPWATAPKYLLRDRDAVYGACFQRRAAALGIDQILTTPRSPWQNAYAERLIGSIRRECLDHGVVFSEGHRRRLRTSSSHYSHRWRTHLSLAMDCPESRPVFPPDRGPVVAFPEVGGLHHHSERIAAWFSRTGALQERRSMNIREAQADRRKINNVGIVSYRKRQDTYGAPRQSRPYQARTKHRFNASARRP